MTTSLPDPLVPVAVDLQDFAFLPLDVVRLRDSSLAIEASGDEFRAAVLLWCAAWHQVPAGSLPDDDRALAAYTLYGRVVKEWQRVREGALRGWIRCSDGRLYHPVLAEKVNEAWRGKLRQRWQTECARIKKHSQRHRIDVPMPDFDEWVSLGCPQGQPLPVPGDNPPPVPGTDAGSPGDVPRETASKGQGEGQGQGEVKQKQVPPTAPASPPHRGSAAAPDERERVPAGAKDEGVPPGVKPAVWRMFVGHHAARRRWSTQVAMLTRGHLAALAADGMPPTELDALLTWATTRSLIDLQDAARRRATDLEREHADAQRRRPGESLADAAVRTIQRRGLAEPAEPASGDLIPL